MKNYFLFFTLLLSTSIYANDEYDAVAVDGPGIFSGDKGQFEFKNIFGEKSSASEVQPKTKAENIVSTDTDEFQEFQLWRKAKAANNADYQEFQDWRAYQQYKRANQ